MIPLSHDDLQAVRDGLWLVVNGAGTGGGARIEGRDVAGKTGTAQVISLTGAKIASGKIDVRDHGFFVFFAPRDNPQIAGIVFAEHGEHGYAAAPIAKHVLETFFAKKEGQPLPALPATLKAAAADRQAGRGMRRNRTGNLRTPDPGTVHDRRTPPFGPSRLAACSALCWR